MDDATFTMHARRIMAPLLRGRHQFYPGLSVMGECPACGGDREFEVWTGYDPRDGSPTGYMEECSHCDGTGEVEEPIDIFIDEDDLDEMDAQGCFDALLS